jgi:hypothetical protein
MKVGIYARTATGGGKAIASQREALRCTVEGQGEKVAAEFVDDGYSGLSLDRPGLATLRAAVGAGRIDALWCTSPDRLSRDPDTLVTLLEELDSHRVTVRFIDAPALEMSQVRLLAQMLAIPQRSPEAGTVAAKTPSCDDTATLCPMCQRPFTSTGRARYCSDYCRKKAWRRRHQPPAVPVVVPAPGVPRRPITVYECASCGTRALGDQRCETCGAFMGRVGLGGLCPECDAPVAVADLFDERAVSSAQGAGPAPTGKKAYR